MVEKKYFALSESLLTHSSWQAQAIMEPGSISKLRKSLIPADDLYVSNALAKITFPSFGLITTICIPL